MGNCQDITDCFNGDKSKPWCATSVMENGEVETMGNCKDITDCFNEETSEENDRKGG